MTTKTIDPQVGKDFVEHFGTKGMRWGVRKERTDYGHGKGKKDDKDGKKGNKDTPPKPKTVVGKTKTTGKPVAEMSDAQLKRINNRLNMEQQYAKMTDPGPSVAKRVLGSVAKFGMQAGRQIAMTQVTALGNEAASKKIGGLMTQKAAAATRKNMAKQLAKQGGSFI